MQRPPRYGGLPKSPCSLASFYRAFDELFCGYSGLAADKGWMSCVHDDLGRFGKLHQHSSRSRSL